MKTMFKNLDLMNRERFMYSFFLSTPMSHISEHSRGMLQCERFREYRFSDSYIA